MEESWPGVTGEQVRDDVGWIRDVIELNQIFT
jgi:hypothetical protein